MLLAYDCSTHHGNLYTMSQPIQPATCALLPKQFLVTRQRLDPKPGWQQFQLGAYHVYHAPGVGATRIRNFENDPQTQTAVLGWFGYRDTFYSGHGPGELLTHRSLKDIYPEMTGRFVVLSRQGDRLLCTTDAGAQLPVVYRPETGELGSTPLVLGWTMALEKAPRISAEFPRVDGTVWYPFGATPFVGVERLLPQRTVALSSRGARLTEWQPANPASLGVSQMHGVARDFIRSLEKSEDSMECHLTAGWDSRMVLSASWPLKHKIVYLTYLAQGATARIDSEMASHMAQRFGLGHETIPVLNPSPEDIDQWLARTSECIRDSVTGLTRTIVESYNHHYGLAGVGGEVGRAFYWKKRDIGQNGLTPEELLVRLGFGKTRGALSRADRWLDDYRDQSRAGILDRAYIDIRLGCWAGPSLSGHLVEKPTLSPFNSLVLYESMLALPQSYRLSGAFARDFIAQGCAELARLPVNRATGIRRLRGLPREVARVLPKHARARIRRLLFSGTPA
jgi:hypothetical protein